VKPEMAHCPHQGTGMADPEFRGKSHLTKVHVVLHLPTEAISRFS